MCVTFRGDEQTRYLLNLDYDENDEDSRRFIPVSEHQKLTGPDLDPGDVVGAACEAVRLAQEKYGESFDELNFNEKLALMGQERPKAFRRLAARKVMSLIRRRPPYRIPVIGVLRQTRSRIRAPRRSRRSVAVAFRGGGDDGGGGDPDQSDPPRPRLPALGTLILFPLQLRNPKAPWRRRRPGPCRMARYLRPVPRSRHGCLGPP